MNVATFAYLALTIMIAGMIRGYSGFGFAMVAVLSWSMVLPPVQVVPVLLLMDFSSGLFLVPGIWKQIHWRSISWLLAGVLVGTPMGAILLATIPENPMRIFISAMVLVLSALLWTEGRLSIRPGKLGTWFTGMISGVLNGSSRIGGPPVILLYLSQPAGIAESRASMITFFILTDVVSSLMVATQGLITFQTLRLLAFFLPPLVAGTLIGSRLFSRSSSRSFRKRVLTLLICLSLITLARSALFS